MKVLAFALAVGCIVLAAHLDARRRRQRGKPPTYAEHFLRADHEKRLRAWRGER